jgi:hypothetical protein
LTIGTGRENARLTFLGDFDRDRRSVVSRAPRGEPSLPAARLNGMPSPKEYRQRAKEAGN